MPPLLLGEPQLGQRVTPGRARHGCDEEHEQIARVDEAADGLVVFEAGAQILAVEEDVVPLREEREIQALREGALV
jgi:hypothetical protein